MCESHRNYLSLPVACVHLQSVQMQVDGHRCQQRPNWGPFHATRLKDHEIKLHSSEPLHTNAHLGYRQLIRRTMLWLNNLDLQSNSFLQSLHCDVENQPELAIKASRHLTQPFLVQDSGSPTLCQVPDSVHSANVQLQRAKRKRSRYLSHLLNLRQ